MDETTEGNAGLELSAISTVTEATEERTNADEPP
jgi:hypothetical protein